MKHIAHPQSHNLDEIQQLGESTVQLFNRLGTTLEESESYTLALEQETNKLEKETNFDLLTGLPNRKHFKNSLEMALQICELHGMAAAVFFIDLDGFKQVNDKYGHSAGDLLLTQAGRRLQSSFRSVDTICRIGGDEFGAVITYDNDLALIKQIAERTVLDLRNDFSIHNQRVHIGCSIGISLYPKDTKSPNELINMADAAMYKAKTSGKGHYQFFQPGFEPHVRELILEPSDSDTIAQN